MRHWYTQQRTYNYQTNHRRHHRTPHNDLPLRSPNNRVQYRRERGRKRRYRGDFPEPLFLVLVKGILFSYWKAMERDSGDGIPLRHLWYHYVSHGSSSQIREMKRRVTDFELEPDDFDSWAFSPLDFNFTIKFWWEEGF